MFQDDNDPKHRAKTVKEWKEAQELDGLDWPSSSPDMDIIEHVWGEIKKQIYIGDKSQGSYTKETLWEAVKYAFYN